MKACLLFLVTVCGVGAALAHGKPLPAELDAALARARIPAEAVTVVVQEAGTSHAHHAPARAAWNIHKPLNPASLAKLFTTYAALDELGPAFSWKTPIWFGGPVRAGGVLDGPLYIQGRGDPNLNVERLLLAVQRLRAMGIHEIRGDIVIDQSAFDVPATSPAEFDNEPLRPYNAAPRALLLNWHAVITTFTPDAARGVAMVSVEPPLAGYAADATVPLSNEPCGDWRGGLKATLGDPNRLRFAGAYPLACGEKFWPAAYPDPKLYAQRALTALWQGAGGKLGGTVREGPAPDNTQPTFELSSPPLAEIVRDINKYSNNVMAQQLFLSLPLHSAHRGSAARVTPDDARAFLREWFAQRVGGSTDGLVIDNGSGLSRDARITGSMFARLLQSAWSSTVMPELMSSLPVTGLDGTLRRAKSTAGRAHLKTGSLRDVNGVAGYVLGLSGKRYVLVALVNHANAAAAKPVLDAAVQWAIADNAP